MTTIDAYVDRVLALLPPATPRRAQIALELRGHIAERAAAGMSEGEILRQLGDPVALAESYLAAVPLRAATFGQRAVAMLIDVFTIILVIVPITVLLWNTLPREVQMFSIVIALAGGGFLFAAYIVAFEWQLGQTLGKRALGLRVVTESGTRISFGQSIVRALPMMLQMYWIDVLFALFTERSQRAFELLSRTRVVRD
jgi:uncharacterized RDD family membrane protein YckC